MAAVPNPARIFETLNAFQRSAALRGAIELELFTAIGEGHVTPPAIANRCRADARAIRILCDCLCVDEFLTKSGESYALTPTAALFLDQRSPHYMGSAAKFMQSPHLLQAFEDVAGVVRNGGTLLELEGTTKTNYEGWVEFARSMGTLMSAPAEYLAELVAQRKPGPICVLDIAAGHGLFGIAIAKKNPQARIVALDWQAVLQVARENAAHAGVADRYELLPGDAMQIDYGSGYDVVLITNFFHHFDRPACVGVMHKIERCLNPGGLALTLEFIPDECRITPPQPAQFALTMLGTTPRGDAYTFSEYDSMWREAGLSHNEMFDVPRSTQRVLVSTRQ